MCERTIKLSLEQARKMYKKSLEMDELLLANFSKEELEKPELPKRWEDLVSVSGYFLAQNSNSVIKTVTKSIGDINNGSSYSIFATEKQALSALAMAQLSQLMKVYNGGWEPNRSDPVKTLALVHHRLEAPKYVICRKNNSIERDTFYNAFQFLTFKTIELRDEFLKNFEPLIKQYFMID